MKKIYLSALFLMTLGTLTFAQSGAMIEFKINSTAGASGTIKHFYAPAGSRMEMQINIPQMPGGGITKTNIVKSDKPTTVYSLDDKNKTYTLTEVKNTANESREEEYTVKVIGKEKVGNYNCTHCIVTKGNQSNEFWTSTDVIGYEKYLTNNGNKYSGSSAEYAAMAKNGAPGFIVKSLTKDPRGGDFTMELVKFEKKEVAASLITIPSDYKQSGTTTSTPAQNIDMNKLQNMSPEERAKYIEDIKKQYGVPAGGN